MTLTVATSRLVNIYDAFLRQADWYPSNRTPGNLIISGPWTTMVCREGYGSSDWYGFTKNPALSPLIRYTDFYKTPEQAKEAAIQKTIAWFHEALDILPSQLPLLAPVNDNSPPPANDNSLDHELKAWLSRKR
jgi:hypothetical protein